MYIITTLEISDIEIQWNRNAILYMANFGINDVSLDLPPGGFRIQSHDC